MKGLTQKNGRADPKKWKSITQKIRRSGSKMGRSDSEKWEGLTPKNGKVWLENEQD